MQWPSAESRNESPGDTMGAKCSTLLTRIVVIADIYARHVVFSAVSHTAPARVTLFRSQPFSAPSSTRCRRRRRQSAFQIESNDCLKFESRWRCGPPEHVRFACHRPGPKTHWKCHSQVRLQGKRESDLLRLVSVVLCVRTPSGSLSAHLTQVCVENPKIKSPELTPGEISVSSRGYHPFKNIPGGIIPKTPTNLVLIAFCV